MRSLAAGALASMVVIAGVFGAGSPALATTPPSVPAPAADGTNGADDGPSVIYIGDGTQGRDGAVALGPTVCDPNSTWYTASGATKSGAVTNWIKVLRNDSTPETLTITTTSTATVTASASVTGSLTASVAVKKVAEVALGISSNYGLTGQIASTLTVTRTVSFSAPGKWVVYGGVYKGGGSVQMKKCSSNGQTISNAGSGTASTFDKGKVTGLLNCANSASDLVALSAKTKC